MPRPSCWISRCTPTSQATAGESRYCPLISHHPPRFESIVNYLCKCSSYPTGEVDSTGQAKYVWQQNSVILEVETVHPLLLPIGPSVSLLEVGSPFCTMQALHFSPTHFSFLMLPQTSTHTHTNIHEQFLCCSLAKRPVFNK